MPLSSGVEKPLNVTASPTRKGVSMPFAATESARAPLLSFERWSATVPLQLGSALPNLPISGRYQTLSGQMSTVPPSSANTFGRVENSGASAAEPFVIS